MKPTMTSVSPCTSIEYPRPLSAEFHHQPVGWKLAVPAPATCRSMGMVPPGQVSVPCVASANCSRTSPASPPVGALYAPRSVWPSRTE